MNKEILSVVLFKLKRIILKNKTVLSNDDNIMARAKKNKVNLNAWIVPDSDNQNVGDYLSKVVVEEMCKFKGVDFDKELSSAKHLYAIGSVLLGYQDSVVWGSGFGYDTSNSKLFKFDAFLHRHYHTLDIRAVRGPVTRNILLKMGISCPEVYGDPAVLMPLFYNQQVVKNKDYIVVPHYSRYDDIQDDNKISTFTTNYKRFIDKILQSKLVISSSLHGIILAEAYGIPAIMLKDTPSNDITKYRDWYYSTGRKNFIIANTIDDALKLDVKPIKPEVIIKMQNDLLDSFPIDLWK